MNKKNMRRKKELIFSIILFLSISLSLEVFSQPQQTIKSLLNRKIHLGDRKPYFSNNFKLNNHEQIAQAYISMDVLDVVLPDRTNKPYHPPDGGYYYDYIYINGNKLDYINRHVKPIRPTSSFQSGTWQTIKIPIPSSFLVEGSNTFKFSMGYYNGNYEDLDVKNIFVELQIVENEPPRIEITNPDIARGIEIRSKSIINIAGKAMDADGIYGVTINGNRADLDNKGNFIFSLPLVLGENKITVIATDMKMKSSSRSFIVSRKQENIVSSTLNSSKKRLALVIGNSEYTHGGSLSNPVNDARAMEIILEKLDFTVIEAENITQKKMKRVIDEFGRRLKGFDVGLFFYAGHGIQANGNNYLIPIDAIMKHENDVEYDAVRADRVLAKMENADSKTNIVILDACRDNPFERSWRRSGKGSGLAFMNAPSGSIIAYATSPGETASDGSGKNGLYTSAILEHITTPGIPIEEMFKRVRSTLIDKSNNKQISWEATSLRGNFYFKPK